ncbi:substrate-binding domain-containing protein [Mucilaginibacter sp. CAU 1740]|uniref:PstS family phosphate ABC transporter substrate-binding protein n=1 Tax=Mucilaginibacter sp. CAU 1740 TaxID=3140365 RepID=UPI00325AD638
MLVKNSAISFYVFFVLAVGVALQSCERKKDKHISNDTYKSGKVTFVVDDSFSPIISQEQYVFESLNPDAHINMLYKTENEAVNMLLNDSVRVAVLSRDLKPAEKDILKKYGLIPEVVRFATDAVTLIVNKASVDTTITVGALKKMLNGQETQNKTIVFDNPNSSLVRYLKDFSGNQQLKEKNIYALKSNKDVIKYVSEHTDAIGIVGFAWLDDPDKDYAPYVDKVNIVGVRDEANKAFPDQYFKPSQETMVLKQYPLSRGLYMINNTNKSGLGAGFTNFLANDRGQRIILKSGLLPDSIPPREVYLKSKL